jgi:hypothetical protein
LVAHTYTFKSSLLNLKASTPKRFYTLRFCQKRKTFCLKFAPQKSDGNGVKATLGILLSILNLLDMKFFLNEQDGMYANCISKLPFVNEILRPF